MSCSPSQVWRPASASSSLVEEVLFAFAGVEGLNLVVVGVFWFVERHGVHDLPEHVFFNVGVDESDDLLARTAGLNSQPPRGPTCVRRAGRWCSCCDTARMIPSAL